ncbi:uncharacterized protein LOC116170179 [Photinus pyralis]|uniref:uncharacterized protein LOC116170179 n=1 Tax=Photinus pyralis TaxID=7054 RepID=UPI0012677354|nr:uncharacterized protein LOC116170179 [Photinus pyralis]
MKTAAALLFLLITASVSKIALSLHSGTNCETRTFPEPRIASDLSFDISFEVNKIVAEISRNNSNFSDISQQVLSLHPEITGIILSSSVRLPILSLNIRERLKIFPNRTIETDVFWRTFETTNNGWGAPFLDCNFLQGVWFYAYVLKSADVGLGLFVPIKLNQCDYELADIFGGPHQCDEDTTKVSIYFD